MSAQDNGGPAFTSHGTMGEVVQQGMTLRDYFAAHAPNPPNAWRGGEKSVANLVEWQYWYADQMLKERAK